MRLILIANTSNSLIRLSPIACPAASSETVHSFDRWLIPYRARHKHGRAECAVVDFLLIGAVEEQRHIVDLSYPYYNPRLERAEYGL